MSRLAMFSFGCMQPCRRVTKPLTSYNVELTGWCNSFRSYSKSQFSQSTQGDRAHVMCAVCWKYSSRVIYKDLDMNYYSLICNQSQVWLTPLHVTTTWHTIVFTSMIFFYQCNASKGTIHSLVQQKQRYSRTRWRISLRLDTPSRS